MFMSARSADVRVLCTRMPTYCLQQYKELILNSIFTTQTSKTSTVRVRKANVLLFEVLIEKFGAETVTRHASRSAVWVKQLKNMEKIRRRRLAKAAAAPQTDAPPSAADLKKQKRKDSDDDDSGDEMEFLSRSKTASTVATMAAKGGQEKKRATKNELSDSDEDDDEDDGDVEMDEDEE